MLMLIDKIVALVRKGNMLQNSWESEEFKMNYASYNN
jgi:hypothetical protein